VDNSSGVGVLDKAVLVLGSLESGPASLAQLVERSGLARPTAHRLAVALEHHGLVARDAAGRFTLGPRLSQLASTAGDDRLLSIAQPVLVRLRDTTGESAQLFRRRGSVRVCVAASERSSGLRDTIPVGAVLPMSAGSGAQILLAWEDMEEVADLVEEARFPITQLTAVRKRGWASSVAEREAGVASVSAPVFGPDNRVVAAVSVSGPIERLTRQPGRVHAPSVMAAGAALSRALGWRPAAATRP
jgi:DNA-binding IclR family transcriptional regulator